MEKFNRYTREEKEIIRSQYPVLGSNIPVLLKRHTRGSIMATANDLGVGRYIPNWRWGDNVNPEDLWCSWFCGFFDGEGHLLVAKGNRNGGPYPYCGVRIQLREDDLPVLEDIVKNLKVGTIGFLSNRVARSRGGKAFDCCRWQVSRTSELETVILPLFEKYPLRTKKGNEFDLWKEAVLLCQNNRMASVDRLLEISDLLTKMRKRI